MHARSKPGLASGSFRRALSARDLILALVALLLIAAAAVIFLRYKPEDAAPTDKFVSFYCPKCDRLYSLSERQFEDLWNRKAFRQAGGRDMRFECPQCKQIVAQRADERPAKGSPPASGEPREPE